MTASVLNNWLSKKYELRGLTYIQTNTQVETTALDDALKIPIDANKILRYIPIGNKVKSGAVYKMLENMKSGEMPTRLLYSALQKSLIFDNVDTSRVKSRFGFETKTAMEKMLK